MHLSAFRRLQNISFQSDMSFQIPTERYHSSVLKSSVGKEFRVPYVLSTTKASTLFQAQDWWLGEKMEESEPCDLSSLFTEDSTLEHLTQDYECVRILFFKRVAMVFSNPFTPWFPTSPFSDGNKKEFHTISNCSFQLMLLLTLLWNMISLNRS